MCCFGGEQLGSSRVLVDDVVVLYPSPVPGSVPKVRNDDEVACVDRVLHEVLMALGEHSVDVVRLEHRVHPERSANPESSRLVSIILKAPSVGLHRVACEVVAVAVDLLSPSGVR